MIYVSPGPLQGCVINTPGSVLSSTWRGSSGPVLCGLSPAFLGHSSSVWLSPHSGLALLSRQGLGNHGFRSDSCLTAGFDEGERKREALHLG